MEKSWGKSEIPADGSHDELDEQGTARRNFMRTGIAFMGNSAVGVGLARSWPRSESDRAEAETPVTTEETAEISRIESDSFWDEASGYYVRTQLRYDQIQFVDAHNVPVGPPVSFADFIVDRKRITDQGETETFSYRLAPGPVNEIGMAIEGIAGEWIDHVRKKVQAEYTDQEIAEQINIAKEFTHAYSLTDEVELHQRIQNGEVQRYIDLVHYFSEKPTVGAERLSRREYVQTAIEFTEYDPASTTGVPLLVEAELRRLVPGLCAQESKFNAAVTSYAGAQGIFQFMPSTWEQYGGDPDQVTSLRAQTEIAGRFLSDVYADVQHFIGNDSLQKVRDKFADETVFQRDFLVPCVINAYNAGARRVGEGVAQFIQSRSLEDMPVGKDLFQEATHFMKDHDNGVLRAYKEDAQSYTFNVYAQAHALAAVQSS